MREGSYQSRYICLYICCMLHFLWLYVTFPLRLKSGGTRPPRPQPIDAHAL